LSSFREGTWRLTDTAPTSSTSCGGDWGGDVQLYLKYGTSIFVRHFSLQYSVQTGSGAQPASYPVVTGGFSLRIKWQEREADHSRTCSAEVKECIEL
jgi:hypothetical protein